LALLALFEKQIRLHPSPEARNPGVAPVLLERQGVTPDPEATTQGVFSDQLKDVKVTMQDLKERMPSWTAPSRRRNTRSPTPIGCAGNPRATPAGSGATAGLRCL
jgi:hypothetical protein